MMNKGQQTKDIVEEILILGAVTCAGKLSLIIEYVENNIDKGTMEKIKEEAMETLLAE